MRIRLLVPALVLTVAACAQDEAPSAPQRAARFSELATEAGEVSAVLAEMNNELASRGLSVSVARAEWIVSPTPAMPEGRTVFADDRVLRLGSRWVPGDARRGAAGRTTLFYLVDRSDGRTSSGLRNGQTEPAIDRSLVTWDAGTTCSNLPLIKIADGGKDPDVVDGLLGFGRIGTLFLADIIHAGWLPPEFFDRLAPGGGASIVAVTFTFVFGTRPNLTDINGDGYLDTAFKEIYYNDGFAWGINTNTPIDVQSIALHENGHALEQGHFGTLFVTDANGEFHAAPRAVMNASYLGLQQELLGTDEAGHCSLFANWPQSG